MRVIFLATSFTLTFGILAAQEPADTSRFQMVATSISDPVIPTSSGVEDETIVFSDPPTTQELVDALAMAASGERDPFEVLGFVVQCGEKAVPGLEEILYSDIPKTSVIARMESDSGVVEVSRARPGKIYASLALEAIGTASAIKILFRAALDHADRLVRTYALNVMGTTALSLTRGGQVIPDKEVIHLLLRHVDDSTRSTFFQKTVGEIARDGLRNWLQMDLGDLNPAVKSLRMGSEDIPISEYRDNWWSENRDHIVWSDSKKSFEIIP